MPRTKNDRKLSFTPKYTKFAPIEVESSDTIALLAEEIEALYLIDLRDLYQDDAAKLIEISRPTLARIIKSARKKIALCLLMGKSIQFIKEETPFTVAFCANEKEVYNNLHSKNKFICIFTFDSKGALLEKKFLENPLYKEALKPAITLTSIFLEYGVNRYITQEIGEGFKSTLVSKGIDVVLQKEYFVPNTF